MSLVNEAGASVPIGRSQAPAGVLADRFLHVVLYITIVSSFFVFVEPAPCDYLAAILGFACILARVGINRVVLPLLVLLLIREVGGVVGLLTILDSGWMRLAGDPSPLGANFDYTDSMRFLATSFYLGLTGVMFACLVAQDTTRRVATIRSAYITSAVVASLLGTLGFFNLSYNFMPGLEIFTLWDRATGGSKTPDDFAAFLIAPLLWLMEGCITDKIRVPNLIASVIICMGLLLAFSRGAWITCPISLALFFYFIFISQNDRRVRGRVILIVLGGLIIAVGVVMVLTSVDVVSQMFSQRARLLQPYDLGGDNRSRFLLQQDSLREIFSHPLGMGPWGFAHATNWVSHNTFLGTTLNHGWIGGAAYLTVIMLTLIVGFRAFWVRTPWQTFSIATYFSFAAMVLESFWGDSDHWRHFYLLLGLVWGLAAATIEFCRRERLSIAAENMPPDGATRRA